MNTLGRKGIASIGALVCVAVLVAGWFLLIAPVRSDISKTKADTVTQTSENSSLQLTLSTMRSIKANLPKETAELAALSQRVPDNTQLPALLRAIQDAATTTGVTLTGLTPSLPSALPSAPGISAVAITLNVTGAYADLEQFDSALETLKRTYLVTSFSLTSGGQAAGAAAAATTITASFTGQVLVKTATATAGN